MNHNHVPISIEKGKQNIFEDLGFEPEIAANLKIRTDLILDLQKYIQEQGWTQNQAAKFFNETQPRISNLNNFDCFQLLLCQLI